MARIIYPDDFAGQQTLFKAILAQHEALGTKSPLTPFAKLQKLDLVKMKNAIAPAAEQNAASGSLRRSSEEDTQQRNLTMEMPWAHFTGEVDFLKGFYKGMERQLGEWGITVDGKDRIVYPNGTAARVDLMKIFVEHHQSFAPGESPLQWYMDEHPDINIEDDLQAAKDALEIEVARDKASGDSEQATQT
ncbi:MAG: hypothetical protein INR73_29405, partial [Williamsia sp.]|nr:hypothetical protein [Williamsia sp.]